MDTGYHLGICFQRRRLAFALHWVGSVGTVSPQCVHVCLWQRERQKEGVTKGVKIPYRSKINPLSHGLTFTESWSVGVREGVALWVWTRARCVYACVYMRFPSAEEKSSIDVRWRSCSHVKCGPGSEGNSGIFHRYIAVCVCTFPMFAQRGMTF